MDDVRNKIEKIINNKKVRLVAKILIILLFAGISLFIAFKHEHWSDEAQSFLIAKDTTFLEAFKYIKYEGTPPLWVLTIKLFILCGGTYETFYLLPIICSLFGLVLFEFKIKAPWYIKVLFPFTYFIMFQYTIVARSYCLVFPILMMLLILYKNRFKKPLLFAFILFLFMNISLHTLVIAGSIYLLHIIECVKTKKVKNKEIMMSLVVIFLEFLLTTIVTIPASDCSYIMRIGESLFKIMSEATVGSELNWFLEFIVGVLVIVVLNYKITKENVFKFLVLFTPLLLILMFICYKDWHIGIVWLLIFYYLVTTNKINDSKLIKIFTVLVCVVQIYWTGNSMYYDYNNNYSASKEVASYIEKYVEEDKIIYGIGFNKTAIQPYFDEQIFDNRMTDKLFYLWANDNKERFISKVSKDDPDVLIVCDFQMEYYLMLMKTLKDRGYRETRFIGNIYMKDRIYVPEGYLVYEKNDV